MHFSDTPDNEGFLEQQLLFSVEGSTATEVTHRGLQFDASLHSLFDGTKVTKPIAVMVEGEYSVLNRSTRQLQKVKITAADIKNYLDNTPRDVAVNYEHRTASDGKPKGWLRLKDTARIGTLETREGPKIALFSSLELFEEATSDVSKGYFRDVSIELKPIAREMTGIALTATPVMRDVQFYSNALPAENGEGVADLEPDADTPVTEAAPEPQPAAFSDTDPSPATSDPTPEEELMSTEPAAPAAPAEAPAIDRKALLAEALQEFGLTPEDLSAVPGLIKASEAAVRAGRYNDAVATVTGMVTKDGKTIMTKSGIDAAAQIMVFAQENAPDDLVFSVDGVTDDEGAVRDLNIEQVFEQLFASIEGVQVFGESEGVSADELEPKVPSAISADQTADPDRVAALKQRIKSSYAARGV